ncbi:enoyl-CoA hydratase/isomerase family protein [Sphingomonas sp.]|uniref:enoyl-CoA hydratase/isomerase family protein n=1 Tax=Sphingomonas sp. TaxID=28214 RepID=UPI002DD6A568|nr:enoyl-CoA hydratase-related protein [Sphingomonas sp.]
MTAAADEPVIYAQDGRRGVITLNRPDRRNAMIWPMMEAMAALLKRLRDDRSVDVLVLRGAGGNFCAGADIAALPSGPGGRIARHFERAPFYHMGRLLREMPQVTIAQVEGACAGAGFAWACACDLRYAATDAVFATAFLNVAVAGDMGGAWLLPRLVGSARAHELFFFPRKIDGAQAATIGLVNEVFASDALAAAVDARSAELARRSPTALRTMKANFLTAERTGFAEYTEIESARHALLSEGPDVKEAFEAFLAKREPQFAGS